MTGSEHKDQSRDFEDRLLSQRYHSVAKERPNKTLDEAILAASRKAVRSRPRTTGPFHGHWPARFAVAATIVVAVIILPDLFQQSQKQADLPVLSPAFEVAPVLDAASTLETASEQAASKSSSTAPMQQEMRIQAQAGRKQPRGKSDQTTLERRAMVPKKRYLLEQAPKVDTKAPRRPVAKQSLGRVSPGASLEQRKYSAFTRSQSAAQSPRSKPTALSSRTSQGARVSRAPEATKSGKNNLLNRKIRLNAIRQLLKTGKIDAARKLARQFAKDYPNDPLPKDLEFLAVQ